MSEDKRRVRVTDKRHAARPADEQRPPAEAAAAEAPADPREPEPASPGAAGDELGEARAQAAEYLDHLQRLQAEFENYRKRTLKEQTRAIEFASEGIVRKLLEVLDDFELAISSAEARPELERFLRGFELVYAKFVDALRAEGLERIDAEGKPFDPEQHEALMSADDHEGEPHVVDVLRPGYRLKGRVIRPAGVRVGRARGEATGE